MEYENVALEFDHPEEANLKFSLPREMGDSSTCTQCFKSVTCWFAILYMCIGTSAVVDATTHKAPTAAETTTIEGMTNKFYTGKCI